MNSDYEQLGELYDDECRKNKQLQIELYEVKELLSAIWLFTPTLTIGEVDKRVKQALKKKK